MLDSKCLRQTIFQTAEQLASRGYSLDVQLITSLETKRKALQVETQALQNQRNTYSKAIGLAKSQGKESDTLLTEVNALNEKLLLHEKELAALQEQLKTIYLTIPNLPHATVPLGKKESDNQEVRRWGTLKKMDFEAKDHVDLGGDRHLMDFQAAAKITGSRFTVLYGPLAQLHRALIQFMLDVHTKEHGYQEVYVPCIVNSESLYGTGQLPKLADDLFAIQGESNYYLIPTGEVPLTNLARDTIFDADELPKKLVCHTPCFRSEAGSYGKDTRGMLRQHQFEKIELVQFCQPEHSYQLLEALTSEAESILKKLNLPYRVVSLCSGDLGFSSAKTYDLEVWLPSQKCYREISSCSNFEAFQARRLQARWKNPHTHQIEWIHTLNGSGLAAGRTLVAIMENYQDEQGKIHVPEVLQSYMGRQEI